jgi:hypothetical protein
VIAKIIDTDALSSIAPMALHAYLRALDWEKTSTHGDKGDVYQHANHPAIVAPASSDFADYATTISTALKILSDFEERSQLSILRDLNVADTDLIRIRAPEAGDDGSIPIDSGVSLVQQSRDLLLAAACAASKPQRAFRAGKIREAIEYLNDVRIGQTERGSFVVTLISPVPPTLTYTGQQPLWPEIADDPFSRRVTRTLASALQATKEAVALVNRGNGIEAFESRVAHGVSANLCAAAAQLIEDGNGLGISLTWALTRPAPERNTRVEFSKSDAATLYEAAKELREREPRPDERIEGFVTALARDENAVEGRVTVKSPIDGKMSSIRIDFGPRDYKKIVEAHEQRQAISLEGDLEREGQRWKLSNPRGLDILPKDPDESGN